LFEPPEVLGKYRILRRLGEGGMGVVFLAFDGSLGRRVALKWLKQATPATMERLQQEAHLHARVEHPSVCRLYGVEEWEGWPFLVMQFIEGTTLDQLAPGLSLMAKLRIFAAITDGVQAAHRQGLIHRDLKPSNVMLEQDEAGGWRPYVMDFGLAREEASGTLTSAGTMLGSPAYMAPEQIRGEWVDVRTDVYGLGATFFEALVGRPPFEGQAAEILLQTQTSEAPALRALVPSLPRHLETIIGICLAKDPARRYPSASALRDDLLRVIDGEPPRARRASRAVKLLAWARRNRLASALAVVCMISVLATAGVWELGRRRAQARAYWAERFGVEAMRMDSLLRFGRLLPPHDLSRELGQVRRRMDLVRQEMAGTSAGRGPGHFVLGQGWMLQGDYEMARLEFNTAWAAGHQTPEVSMALGFCLGSLYETEYEKSLTILDLHQRKVRQDTIRRELLEPGRKHLTAARQAQRGAFSTIEEARFALAEERFGDADRLAHEAYQAEPWRYEALFYLARALSLQARDALFAGRNPEAKGLYDRVLDLADVAARIGPSDERMEDVRRSAWATGCRLGLRGRGYRASLEQARAACNAMHHLNSTRTDYFNQHAVILVSLGVDSASRGQDPEPLFQEAGALMKPIVQSPLGVYPPMTRTKALERLGSLAHQRAKVALDRHADPRPFIDEGIRWSQQAVKEGLAQWETHQNLGMLEMDLARFRKSREEETQQALDQVVLHFRDCAQLYPSAASWSNLAEVCHDAARRRIERGEDPGRDLQAAREALALSAKEAPGTALISGYEGDRYLLEARWQIHRRQDPRSILDKALMAYETARRIQPDDASFSLGLAQTHALLAEALGVRREAEQALYWSQQALQRKADPEEVRTVQATAHRLLGRSSWNTRIGRSPAGIGGSW